MAKSNEKTEIIYNRRAKHDYHLLEKFEAGLVLEGWEVKAIKDHRIHIQESYIDIRNQQCWLIGSHIEPKASTSGFQKVNPIRERKCLLHKKEINKLFAKKQQKGLTLIAVKIYTKKRYIKLEIALAQGKKNYDKRAAEKQKTWEKEKKALLKSHRN